MEKLTIITPCSRPQNLHVIYPEVKKGLDYFDLEWIIAYDILHLKEEPQRFTDEWITQLDVIDQTSVSGNGMRNQAIEHTEYKGYLWFLDDDNTVHPEFFQSMSEAVKTFPEVDAWILTQDLGRGRIREAKQSIVKATHIDQAQYFIRRDFLQDARFIQDYCADGILIEALYRRGGNFKYIPNKVLVYYNRLNQ